jgi:hypothetical protein
MTVDVLARFLDCLETYNHVQDLDDRLTDLEQRIRRVGVCHERFLTNQAKVAPRLGPIKPWGGITSKIRH